MHLNPNVSWSELTGLFAFIQACVVKVEWTHTPHVKCSPRTNRLRSSTNDMAPGECAEGKSFVDTAEDAGVAGRPLIEAHAPIQLRQVVDISHANQPIHAPTRVFKEAQECDQRDTSGCHFSRWHEQRPRGYEPLGANKTCCLLEKSELLATCSAAGRASSALLFSFFFKSSARRVTHSQWHGAGAGICHLQTHKRLLSSRRQRVVHSRFMSCSRVRGGVTHPAPPPGSNA